MLRKLLLTFTYLIGTLILFFGMTLIFNWLSPYFKEDFYDSLRLSFHGVCYALALLLMSIACRFIYNIWSMWRRFHIRFELTLFNALLENGSRVDEHVITWTMKTTPEKAEKIISMWRSQDPGIPSEIHERIGNIMFFGGSRLEWKKDK